MLFLWVLYGISTGAQRTPVGRGHSTGDTRPELRELDGPAWQSPPPNDRDPLHSSHQEGRARWGPTRPPEQSEFLGAQSSTGPPHVGVCTYLNKGHGNEQQNTKSNGSIPFGNMFIIFSLVSLPSLMQIVRLLFLRDFGKQTIQQHAELIFSF